ncbi:M23 family metallopeptidase [Salipaludibacillus sp. CF4.18]|uniref:M23 family metallopeptidase n=1 Tax=Salipaludibacillus sp. CF4.18 TaxID=3373081 RepID=UPI003EE45EB2
MMRQLKYKMIALPLLILTLASGCSSEVARKSDKEKSNADQEFVITPEDFPDTFLNGDIAKVYHQTSGDFRGIVSAEEFTDLGKNFNEGVKSYELVSELSLNEYTEYQWINETKDKGIRSYFSEDHTIQGLELLPLTDFVQQNKTYTEMTYTMPVLNEWFTFWGGTNELVNYHYPVESQRYAYDLVIMKNGSTFKGNPGKNENYYAFGELVLSPEDGTVVASENTIADNTPTVDTNEKEPLGNHLVIDHGNGEYSVLAHFQEGSVQVKTGDNVYAGDILGLCGNSGNSSEPHIHYHVADNADWQQAKSLQIRFKDETSPVRGEKVIGF